MVQEAPLDNLPSCMEKSFQAMLALKGRADWKSRRPALDESGIPRHEKVTLLQVCHEELSHMGGANPIVQALREEGKVWMNILLDAQWVASRCEDCLTGEARGSAKGEPRN